MLLSFALFSGTTDNNGTVYHSASIPLAHIYLASTTQSLLSTPGRLSAHFQHLLHTTHLFTTHPTTTMCKRMTTTYLRCGHVVPNNDKCDEARQATSDANPPKSIWCKPISWYTQNSNCPRCRKASNDRARERARRNRSGERPYRGAVGCEVM